MKTTLILVSLMLFSGRGFSQTASGSVQNADGSKTLITCTYGGCMETSVLAGQRPGTTIKMLMDKTTVYIKVPGDDRESHYRIVGSSTAK